MEVVCWIKEWVSTLEPQRLDTPSKLGRLHQLTNLNLGITRDS